MPRTPLIPRITDTDENIHGVAKYLQELGIKNAALMPYNPLWHDKADKVGVHNSYRGDKVMTEWMEQKQIERCRKIFNDKGIAVV
ncbi:MAG: hypothetical protein MZU91_09555 [Desulfosudis oleivorans]|nr:hypothetical protein [Desulfosudis oleivorans]